MNNSINGPRGDAPTRSWRPMDVSEKRDVSEKGIAPKKTTKKHSTSQGRSFTQGSTNPASSNAALEQLKKSIPEEYYRIRTPAQLKASKHYYGDMTRDEANDILRDQPNKTGLLRYNARDFFISYKNQEGEHIHKRLRDSSLGEFLLEKYEEIEGLLEPISSEGPASVAEDLKTAPFYHGTVTGEEAEKLLKNKDIAPGTGLVRYSNTFQEIILSYKNQDGICFHQPLTADYLLKEAIKDCGVEKWLPAIKK